MRILCSAVILVGLGMFAAAQPMVAPMIENPPAVADADRLETVTGKSILVFTPHPDDEHFAMAATLSLLSKNKNTIHVVIFTNDNRGSKDLEMTRERLAQIRRAEEEAASKVVDIPIENLHWLGYEDGDLEYADPKHLRGELARQIKKYRPDIVFSPDPGATWVQWHKTDHRMGANITQDAFIAAQWHLYYPQHYLDEKLEPFSVPLVYYYYSQAPNYEVDITGLYETKVKAVAAHVSQFEPSNSKYTPDMPEETLKQLHEGLRTASMSGNRLVERFRRQESP
ncbi:MAG: PIG-L deacetylase family protein [Candidatus Hydrogenedentes bacterium]|nr:PIG-L deacetylase family protein [Candidatus Hydrogenedentota bacterium]